MSQSFSNTESHTFTLTHAKHISAKVATDLKRMQRFYRFPSDAEIARYESEVIEYLKAGYLATVTYGFKRNGDWIEPTVRYTAHELYGSSANDDDPGRIRPGADVSGAFWGSYMTYSSAWNSLSAQAQAAFVERLPIQRVGAAEPGISGYLADDRTYSSGGRSLNRASVRSF